MKITINQKNLVRRYLIWCYKTTKEELDRIDRYFTQSLVDRRLLDLLLKNDENNVEYQQKVADFRVYMDTKEKNALNKKYLDLKKKTLKPQYQYLQNRLCAIEKVIVEFLGQKELKSIQMLYEKEMTRRILEAREHS